MSTIVFLIDHREGHIIPSFKLAHSLKERGHEIIYLSIKDNEKIVTEQGFKFYIFFESIYCEGFNQNNKKRMDAHVYTYKKKHGAFV